MRRAGNTNAAPIRRDHDTAAQLARFRRQLARYDELQGPAADNYLAQVEADAAPWVLVLYYEIRRLEHELRRLKRDPHR